jgi:hypothetical protein
VIACAASKPWRVSLSLGNWYSAPLLVDIQIAGVARSRRTTIPAATAGTGRRMTAPAQRAQKPGGSGASGRVEPGRLGDRERRMSPRIANTRPRVYARWPSSEISAGSSVAAATTDTATTRIAPSAIERRAVASTIHRPASDTMTVTPEKATATPEVDSATARASSGLRPLRTSAR